MNIWKLYKWTAEFKVKGSNPVQAWIFFRLSFRNCISCIYNCDDLPSNTERNIPFHVSLNAILFPGRFTRKNKRKKKDTTTEEKTFFIPVLDWTGNNRPIEFAEIDRKKNRLRNRKPRKEFSQEKYNNYNKFTKTQKRE